MALEKRTGGGRRGEGRRALRRRTLEVLETRDLLTVVLTLPAFVVEAVPFTGKVATFTSNGPGDVTGTTATDFKATVNYGDGTASATGTVVADGVNSYEVDSSHTYSQFGSFPVSITVTGTNSTSNSAQANLTVNDATLTATSAPAFASTGVPFTGSLGSVLDLNPNSTATDFSVSIQWGDGQTTAGKLVAPASSGSTNTLPIRYSVTGSHTYATAGPENATFTVVRNASGQSVSAISAVSVSGPTLAAKGVSLSAVTGVAFSGPVATFTDSTGTPASGFTATVVWGDNGTTSFPATINQLANGTLQVVASHTYSTAGPFTATVSITRTVNGQTVTVNDPVTVTKAALTASGTTIRTVGGTPFSGPVGSFVDNTGTPASGFTATITWGDSTADTQGTIAPNGTGGFTVFGSHTYAQNGTVPTGVTVKVTRLADMLTSSATTFVILDAPLITVPSSGVAATANLPFTATLATLTDATTGTTVPANFTVSINWGDGTTTPGAIRTVTPTSVTTSLTNNSSTTITPTSTTTTTTPGTSTTTTTPTSSTTVTTPGTTTTTSTPATSPALASYVALIGTHTYSTPGTYTVTTTTTRLSDGQTSTGTLTLNATVVPFTGGLDPVLSPAALIGGVDATTQQQPTVSGTAAPGSAVRVWFTRGLGGDPFPLGETQADATGRWSLNVGPIAGAPIYLYGVSEPPNGPPTPTTLLNGGIPVYVTSHPVSVLGVAYGPRRNSLSLTVSALAAGQSDPSGLVSASSYFLIAADGQRVSPVSVVLSTAKTSHRSASRSLTLVFPNGSLPRRGAANLEVSFAGINGGNGSVFMPVRRR